MKLITVVPFLAIAALANPEPTQRAQRERAGLVARQADAGGTSSLNLAISLPDH